ncbi:MAG TPA: dihydrofolate reductase family protein [Ignavibacteriaceae bacterium]|nr:dihydrofolate reductase family protein [Ignavibacteriaceae bacterium]
MRKLIYDINITTDGIADHTAGIADDELHDFYADLLDNAGIVLFGRKTFQLLEDFWPEADKDPRSTKGMLHFADKINNIQKIVFSGTLNKVKWANSKLVNSDAIEEIKKLKNEPGKDILIGGISLASALMKQKLIDEFLFLLHPIIAGSGRRLWEGLEERVELKLVETRRLNSGTLVLRYLPNY